MLTWFSSRYLDLLGSIYIYNEHRGYTALDRVLEAVRARSPGDHAFLAHPAALREGDKEAHAARPAACAS